MVRGGGQCLLVAAGVLGVLSTFLPVKQITIDSATVSGRAGTHKVIMDLSVWGLHYDNNIHATGQFRPGSPVIVAALLLIVLALLALPWRASRRPVAVIRALVIGCAGVFIGIVRTFGLYVSSYYAGVSSTQVTTVMERGWPVLIGSAVLAALGAIFTLLGTTPAPATGVADAATRDPTVVAYVIEPETESDQPMNNPGPGTEL